MCVATECQGRDTKKSCNVTQIRWIKTATIIIFSIESFAADFLNSSFGLYKVSK